MYHRRTSFRNLKNINVRNSVMLVFIITRGSIWLRLFVFHQVEMNLSSNEIIVHLNSARLKFYWLTWFLCQCLKNQICKRGFDGVCLNIPTCCTCILSYVAFEIITVFINNNAISFIWDHHYMMTGTITLLAIKALSETWTIEHLVLHWSILYFICMHQT